MANTNLFTGAPGPQADTENRAGGRAFSRDAQAALATLACTGTLSDTFYASAQDHLTETLELAQKCDSEYLAKLAVYARESAFMKDMPALLCAVLACRADEQSRALLKRIFPKVINNGKMLRNFVQMLRSGRLGRKSFGTGPKRLVANWLRGRSADQLFHDAVGNQPSFADIIKMVHPKPTSPEQERMFGYMLGKGPPPRDTKANAYELYKIGEGPLPEGLNFQYLTSLEKVDWKAIARNAKWQMTRMNLNTFKRHGVLEDEEMVDMLAARLRDPDEVRKAKVFPYQLLMAYMATRTDGHYAYSHTVSSGLPRELSDALHDAMEVAVENVPALPGHTVLGVDTSGSMGSVVTGSRPGQSSQVRCIDVAGLFAAALFRRAEKATVLPFATELKDASRLNPRDTIMTTAESLARMGGGGTDCSLPLRFLNERGIKADTVIYISDYESWADRYRYRSTGLQEEWKKYKRHNPKARLVCIDIHAQKSSQVADGDGSILRVGGFSDEVFKVLASYAEGGTDPNYWVKVVNGVAL